MQCTDAERFDQAASALGGAAKVLLRAVGERDKALACEIRLRVGAPALLSLPSGLKTIGTDVVTREQMDSMVLSLCGHSVYTHQQEIASGYISVPGGHRAGVCGRAAVSDGRLTAVSDITTVCLRIAREHAGCADRLLKGLFAGGICSAVIAGAPGSGKTTLLRDLACSLADGRTGRRLRVAVTDERGELALTAPSGDTGRVSRLCDVLSGYPKADGINHALRSLSPDVIVCDELGCGEDMNAVLSGINAGVHIICSVHAGSPEELAARPVTGMLLSCGAFKRFAFLGGRDKPGEVEQIIERERLYELAGGAAHGYRFGADRQEPDRPPAQTVGAAGADRTLCGGGAERHKLQPSAAGQACDGL